MLAFISAGELSQWSRSRHRLHYAADIDSFTLCSTRSPDTVAVAHKGRDKHLALLPFIKESLYDTGNQLINRLRTNTTAFIIHVICKLFTDMTRLNYKFGNKIIYTKMYEKVITAFNNKIYSLLV